MLAKLLKLTRVDKRFVIDEFEPASFKLFRAGKIEERITAGLRELESSACPRNCHINRLENEARVCFTGRYAKVGSAFAHFGEEDCLRGWNGSGTIFFSLCNLRCVFCQNWDMANSRSVPSARRCYGKTSQRARIDTARLAYGKHLERVLRRTTKSGPAALYASSPT